MVTCPTANRANNQVLPNSTLMLKVILTCCHVVIFLDTIDGCEIATTDRMMTAVLNTSTITTGTTTPI